MIKAIIRAKFPELSEPALVEAIVKHGKYREVPAGQSIMNAGDYIRSVPLLVSGSIKVLGHDEEGKELLLYHLYPGDSCAMSLTCCMSSRRSEVHAIAEDEVEMIEIPVQKVDEWMEEFRSWKSFVMGTYQKRFDELLQTINHIAFKKMDQRLYKYLAEKSEALASPVIHATHQALADELGTSREVVSRLLKQMEREGMVELGRNEVRFLGAEDS